MADIYGQVAPQFRSLVREGNISILVLAVGAINAVVFNAGSIEGETVS